jgi:hypothetical protein
LNREFYNDLIAVDATMVGNRAWFAGLFSGSGKRRQVSAEKIVLDLTPLQVQMHCRHYHDVFIRQNT